MNSHPVTPAWHRYAVALAAALASALLLTAPITAQAAATDSPTDLSSSVATPLPSCPASTLCTFQNANYNTNGGTRWNFPWSSYPHGTWFWIGSGANDHISSFYNHRGWTSYFDKNCPANKPDWANAKYETADSNLAGNYWTDMTTVNDSISAIALGTSTSITDYPSSGSC